MKWAVRIALALVAALVIAFVLLRTPDTDPDEMRAKYAGAPSQFLEIGGGVTVHLRDEGPRGAVPIILLHGSTADLHTWEPLAEALRGQYRVIRFDQIGHGLTGPDPAGDYSLASFVQDIGEVADALELEQFVLAGSSMGGGHAAAYAMAHPDRVTGLVLVGASGAPVRPERTGSFTYSLAQTPIVNKLLEHVTPRFMVEQSLRDMVTDETLITDPVVDRYWEMLRFPGNRSATIARFGEERTAFEEQDIAAITAPALLIWGEEDPLIPLVSANWYAEHLANSRLLSLPDTGHLPHEEAPGAAADALKSWLANLKDTTAAN